MSSSNVSTDLIWEVCRTSNSFLVKRKTAGGVQLSSDPLNLMNKHSRKAIGIQPGTHGGVKVLTINKKKRTQLHEVDLHPKKSARK
ncbi:MAG: hypothetical protein M1826_007232 [Phylliscum demangeonii]|nr:MAG: hypothetical protein M1826_007232 [Phylliscum demangeonii]